MFYRDKAINRSPGGTGISAWLARLHPKGQLKVANNFRQESLIGTTDEGRVGEVVEVGPFKGIHPNFRGWAQIIVGNTIFVDDRDPLAYGFQIK